MLKVGVDIDGVLVDHVKAKMWKAKALGYGIKPHQTHSVILKKILSRPDYEKLQRYIYGKQTLEMPAVRSALRGFKYLTQCADAYVISRRKTEKNPRLWFRKNIPHFPQKRIFFVKKDVDKDTVAKRLGINIFIDDLLSVLKALPSVRHRFLLDPARVYTRVPRKITVVRSWDDFLKRVKRLL